MDVLCEAMSSGACVVTANQRLARYLRGEYDARQRAAGRRVWDTPQVLPWSAWLAQLWVQRTAGEGQVLLSAAQELVLWERIIAESAQASGLMQIEATARLAREAWQLCRTWSLELDTTDFPLDDDALAYQAWARQFARHCAQAGWVSMAELPVCLASAVAGSAVADDVLREALPAQLILAGFDEITPVQQGLMHALSEVGVRWESWAAPEVAGTVQRIAVPEAEDEVWAAARWARDRLLAAQDAAAGGTGAQQEPVLAVVVPDLDARRESIERIFDAVLHPVSLLPDCSQPEQHWRARRYNLSAGRPLSDYPVVHDALLVLALDLSPQDLARIGAVLRSPFIGAGETERGLRARLDARLRARGETRLTLNYLQRLLAEAEARLVSRTEVEAGLTAAATPDAAAESAADRRGLPSCPQLAARLADWLTRLRELPRRQAASAWAEALPGLLSTLGWPGERELDSLEYQAVQAFQGMFDQLASLDVVHGRLSRAEAVKHLQRLCRAHVFQPEGSVAPVQILGVLEAAGQRFDGLWLMGLHDEVWPAPPRPNPLLPIGLQRRQGVAHASPERELAYTRRLMQRLCASINPSLNSSLNSGANSGAATAAVILSHPLREGDRVLRPSPLLEDMAGLAGQVGEHAADLTPMPANAAGDYAADLLGSVTLESVSDRQGPPVNGTAAGGTAIFKYQAACPFRAFAQLRLGAVPLEEPVAGLDPRERGIVLHSTLEQLWQTLGDHARLLAMDAAALDALIGEVVWAVLTRLARQRPQTFTERFMQLESDRLQSLLRDWLEHECARAPFSVLRQEQERQLALGGVTLRLKIDRIDRLEDDSLAIIDYKTGPIRVGDWLGERPEEPQLPLYVLSEMEPVGAVAFARVSRGEMGFKGLSREAERLPGVDTLAGSRAACDYPDWDSLLADWRTHLTRLGEAFVAGEAAVDPKQYPQSCHWCPLPMLCRINTWLGEVGSEEMAGDNGDG